MQLILPWIAAPLFVVVFCVSGFGTRCIDVGLGGRGVEGRGWGPRLPPPGPAGIVEAGHWPFPPKLREEWRVCIAQSWTPISHIAPGGDQGTHPFPDLAPGGDQSHTTGEDLPKRDVSHNGRNHRESLSQNNCDNGPALMS